MTITIEKIERETEKAILVACEIESCAGRRGVKVWFPKSRTEIDGRALKCEPWLVRARLADLVGENRTSSYWFN